jgi:hypothetical protein
MSEVVDLTFTDSDDETQLRPSQPDHAAPSTKAAGMRTPLRRLLALQRRNEDDAHIKFEKNRCPPLSPEEINLLESPEPPKKYAHREEHHRPNQRPVEEREEEVPKAAHNQNVAGPSRNFRASSRSLAYNSSDYEDQFAELESYEPKYLPRKSPTIAAAAAGGPGGRKPKRSREEMAREKELKKQQK